MTGSFTPRFRETYEVHLRRAGKWTVERMGLSRRDARDLGETAYRSSEIDGYRIVRCRESAATGTITDDVLVEKTREPRHHEAVVGAVTDAPHCEIVDDLFELPARHCLHRLFGQWLAAHEVCVVECLLNPRLMENLLDRGSIVKTAAHRVAGLQTDGPKAELVRRDALLRLIDDARALAATALARASTPAEPSLGAIVERASADLAGGGRHLALARLTGLLSHRQGRLAKVATIVELVTSTTRADTPRDFADLADLVLSDLLLDEETVRELAGPGLQLADQLQWIAAVVAEPLIPGPAVPGDARPVSPHDFGNQLADRMAAERFPLCRQALLLSLDGLLRGHVPLRDGVAARERTAIVRLVATLSDGEIFTGGPRLAARLTDRFADFETAGGSEGFVEAMESLTLDLPGVHNQVVYLTALLAGATVPRVIRGVLGTLDQCIRMLDGLDRLVASGLDTTEFVARIDAQCQLLELSPLGDKSRSAWTGALISALEAGLGARQDAGSGGPSRDPSSLIKTKRVAEVVDRVFS